MLGRAMYKGQGQGGPRCSGEAQEHGSICSMDRAGEKWDLGLGEGVTLSQARSSGVELSLWMWEGCPREPEDCWGRLGGWASP